MPVATDNLAFMGQSQILRNRRRRNKTGGDVSTHAEFEVASE
jgi:hypothetical protein